MAKNLLILILATPFLIASEEFIVRYRLFSYQNKFGSENFTISKTMTKKDLTKYKKSQFCEIEQGITKPTDTLKFLKSHKDKIIECILKSGIFLDSYEKLSKNYMVRRDASITKKPTYFTVDFNQGLAKIQLFDSH